MESQVSNGAHPLFRSQVAVVLIETPRTPTPRLSLAQYQIGGQKKTELGYMQPRDVWSGLKKSILVEVQMSDEEIIVAPSLTPKTEPEFFEVGLVSFPFRLHGRDLRKTTETILRSHPNGNGWRVGGRGSCFGFIRTCFNLTLRGEVVALGPRGEEGKGRILVLRNCNGEQYDARKLHVANMSYLKPTSERMPVHVLVSKPLRPPIP